MKRKLEWEQDDEEDSEESNDEEESEEEPIIQSVLQDLSDAVSHQDAKDILHSMAASKNILFWTPGGELLRNQRRIPVTSITDLLDYVLLPYNRDILKPRALNSFLEGLAELRINKKWIRNKKVLSDLMQKEELEDNKDQSNESDSEESSSDEEQDSDNNDTGSASSDEEQDSDNNDTQEDEDEENGESGTEEDPCVRCGNRDIKVNRIVKCPKCLWHEKLVNFPSSTACSICEHPFSINRNTLKSVITRCHACKTVHHRSPKRNKEESFNLSSDEENV